MSPKSVKNKLLLWQIRKSSHGDEALLDGNFGSQKPELLSPIENLAQAQEDEKHSAARKEGLLKEIKLLKNELKQAIKAEETSKKAMDDLALVLKEVAIEANQTKEKLIAVEDELENFKKELKELKEKFRNSDVKHRTLLDEARKETELYRNTSDRLRLEADELLQACNGKEIGFVDCITIVEEEKLAALEDNSKLLESLTAVEKMNKN